MVKVKTPSGWKTVNPGQSVGSVSVPGSSSGGSSSGGNSNYNTGTPGSSTLYYITDPNTGKVTVTGSPELAGSSYSSGSSVQAGSNYGTGSKSNYNPNTAYDAAAAARIAQQQEAIRQADLQRVAAQKQAEEKRIAEAESFAEKTKIAREVVSQRAGETEAARIEEEKGNLITTGARTVTTTSRDAITKQPLIIKETKKNGHLVREVTNVETGETKTTTYAPGKGGGSVKLTGGVTTTVQVKEETAGAFVKDNEVIPGVGDLNFESISNPDGDRFRISLSEREKQMSTSEVIRGRFGEVGTGLAKVGVGLAETGINLFSLLGVQTIESKESLAEKEAKNIKVVGSGGFEFGGKLGDIRDSPATTGTILGQSLAIAPLLGAGVVSFVGATKTVGLAEAALETVTSISPFKIQAGSFGALESAAKIKDLKFDVVSVKSKAGDVTIRNIIGSTADDTPRAFAFVKQASKSVDGKEVGVSLANIIAPRTEIGRAGQITESIRTLRTESIFVGSKGIPSVVTDGIKLGIEGLTGGGAKVLSRTVLDIIVSPDSGQLVFAPSGKFDFTKVGGVSGKGKVFDPFVSGFGKDEFSFVKDTGLQKSIKVEAFNIKGLELDISKLTGDSGLAFKGSSPTGLVTSQKTTVGSIITTPKPTITTAPVTGSTLGVTSLSAIDTVSALKTETISIVSQAQKPITKIEVRSLNIPKYDVLSISKTKQKSVTRQVERTKQEVRQLTTPKLESLTKQRQDQRTIQRTKQLQKQVTQQERSFPPLFPVGGISTPKIESLGFLGLTFKQTKQPKILTGKYGVSVRRGGMFTSIGRGSLGKVLSLGRQRVGSTLAATFKITGKGVKPIKLPGFRTKSTKEGVLFIEKKKRRIKKKRTGSKEVKELKEAKAKKRRSKK